MIRPLLTTPPFARDVRRAGRRNPSVANAITQALALLEADAFDARLGTHKLAGELAGLWSCSAGYDLRITFEFTKSGGVEAILLVSCGTHDEVY